MYKLIGSVILFIAVLFVVGCQQAGSSEEENGNTPELLPAVFTVSNLLISPTNVGIGESITISVLVTNEGDVAGSYKVTLRIDNVDITSSGFNLTGGSSQTVTFTTSHDEVGIRTVDVNGLSGMFTVTTAPPPTTVEQRPDTIIIDHKSTDINKVPLQWIDQAKSSLGVWYIHTSHGSQITTGMENLQSHYGNPYSFNKNGSGEALSYQEVEGDLGHNGDLTWENKTRKQLNRRDNDRNVVIWSWCGGASDNTEEGIDTYLEAMNQLEIDYPDVVFVYMTGHLDGTGESGNLNIRNNQIRSYCVENNKILFDFADIESYDPDGNYFLNLNANDNCDYDGGNWAQEWSTAYPDSDLNWQCSCAHSQALNCNLKGRAFWWMMARIAGWEG